MRDGWLRQLTSNRAEDVLPVVVARRQADPVREQPHGRLRDLRDADGAGPARRVTRGATPAYGSFWPAWSPGGRLMAFSSSAWAPENQETYVIRPDAPGRHRLTRTKGSAGVLGDDAAPSWSPDGRRIVFTSNRTGEGAIWIMRADGSGQRRLLDLPRRDDGAPRSPPDGHWLAFDSRALGRSDLYLARADGHGLRRLRAGESPAWRPGA